MNKDALAHLNSLLGLARGLAEHGAFPKLTNAVMSEIKRFENDPELLKEAPDGEQPNE